MFTRFLQMTTWASTLACLSGCSLLISAYGPQHSDLESRQLVNDRFGQPDSVSVVELVNPDSEEVQQFEVENHYVHANFNTTMPMGSGSLLMLFAEPYFTCVALYDAAKEYAEVQHLAFVYDEQGNTIGHKYPQSLLQGQFDVRDNVLRWKSPGGTDAR